MLLLIFSWLIGIEIVLQIVLYLYYTYRASLSVILEDLPNGLRLAVTSNGNDSITNYHEIFVDQNYWHHEVKLNPNKPKAHIVFDIGANAGYFTVYLAEKAKQSQHKINIYSFEPIPHIYKSLRYNVENVVKNNKNPYIQSVSHYNCGLSDYIGTGIFRYDLALTVASSMYHEEITNILFKQSFKRLLRATIFDTTLVGATPKSIGNNLILLLDTPIIGSIVSLLLLPFIIILAVHIIIASSLTSRKVKCQLNTVDNIIKQENLQLDNSPNNRIDLMKIDVEGAEEAVLHGLSNLQLVDQYVVEVHNINDRINRLKQLFESSGYLVTIEREKWSSNILSQLLFQTISLLYTNCKLSILLNILYLLRAFHEILDIYTLFARRKDLNY
jgi:FkbM family methyltransferase